MSDSVYFDKEQVEEILGALKIPTVGIGGGFAPIGMLGWYDGKTPPQGWLVCDGTVYNIADYPELAAHYAENYGSANVFGGNGTTTFAVRDLRGEFLRACGTNSHTNQGSGGDVGVHQDATLFPQMLINTSGNYNTSGQTGSGISNYDSSISTEYAKHTYKRASQESSTNNYVTTRPTNTSFPIIIRALPAGNSEGHIYSTEEHIVGTWIDGKPIYEKTYTVANATSDKIIENYSQKQMIDYSGIYLHTDGNRLHFPYYHGSTTMQMNQNANSGNLVIHCSGISGGTVYVTAQYTKITD